MANVFQKSMIRFYACGGSQSVLQPSVLPPTIHGVVFTDRKSKFQAHLACVTSRVQVDSVLSELRRDSHINRATHPAIFACRLDNESLNKSKISNEIHVTDPPILGGLDLDNTLDEFKGDCGEHGAGEQLLNLLKRMQIINVLIVCTRWFGGVQLGADRFRHITGQAKILLDAFQNNANNKRK